MASPRPALRGLKGDGPFDSRQRLAGASLQARSAAVYRRTCTGRCVSPRKAESPAGIAGRSIASRRCAPRWRAQRASSECFDCVGAHAASDGRRSSAARRERAGRRSLFERPTSAACQHCGDRSFHCAPAPAAQRRSWSWALALASGLLSRLGAHCRRFINVEGAPIAPAGRAHLRQSSATSILWWVSASFDAALDPA